MAILCLLLVGVPGLIGCSGSGSEANSDTGFHDSLDSVPVGDFAGNDGTDMVIPDLPLSDLNVTDQTADQADLVPAPCDETKMIRNLVNSADTTFPRGPYLMMLQPDSVWILWRTDQEQDSTVTCNDGQQQQQVYDTTPAIRHAVRLTGLRPDTDYEYTVASGGVTSQTHVFHTAVAPNQPFRFVVWGDSQNGPGVLGPLVDLMIEAGPHIALGLGDHVEEGSEASQWDDHLFGPARALFHQVPFFATRGNHEQNPMHFLDAYQYDLPQDPLDVATYYKFTYGNAFFLVIESNTLVCPIGDYNPPQFDFIKAALESPEAKAATWRFAFTHEAAYSEAWPTFEGDLCIRDTILPMLDQAGFHGFFAGHTHSYERGIVGGILHIISGGGGGGLDTWARDLKPTTVVYLGHHFLRIDAGCEQLKLEAVALDGTVIDWVVLSPEHQILSQGTAGGLDGLILTP